jgi:hypothetical protein
MRAPFLVRKLWPAVSAGLIAFALFGGLPPGISYGLAVIGIGIAAYTITALVKVYRFDNRPIDYSWLAETTPKESTDDE